MLNRERRIRRMRRVCIASADMARDVASRGGRRLRAVFVTLTYANGVQWSSRHISAYLDHAKKFLYRRYRFKACYQWVIELTKRGIPHYHAIFWLPHNAKLPKPDASGHWPHGMSNIKAAYRPVGYLLKYATKGGIESNPLPRGCRLFGVGAGGDQDILHARHRYGLPVWLFSATGEGAGERYVREAFVGWRGIASGAILQTPFAVRFERNDEGFVCLIVEPKA